MFKNLVSVVTPVYNVEKYLDDYFKSITKQTYEDIEIIAVNDASTDGSATICNLWSEKDSRIRIIHKSKNEGVAAARNTALDHCRGSYIYFIDPDDIASPYLVETLLKNIKQYDADVSLCHEVAFKEGEDSPVFDSTPINSIIIESQDEYLQHFIEPFTGPIGWMWNKLYKRDVIDKLRFKEFKVLEDISFNASASIGIHKAVWCEDRLYGYRIRESSLTGAGKTDITLEAAEAWLYTYNVFQKSIPSFADKYLPYLLGKFASLRAQSRAHFGIESEMKMKEFYNDVYDKNISKLGFTNLKDRIKLFLARYAFDLFYINARRHV